MRVLRSCADNLFQNNGTFSPELPPLENAIATGHRRELLALAKERAAVRTALTRALSLSETAEIDAALAAAIRAAFQEESGGPFRADRAAGFEPDLALGQRRLRFDRATEPLGLPLPAGE